MANPSISTPSNPSSAGPLAPEVAEVLEAAPGRLAHLDPAAVIDIGSNSVRLVVYEGLTRAPAPIFNEKVLCGLGRHVASRGVLDEDAVARALEALSRFGALAKQLRAGTLHVIATAAVREATNGADFVVRAETVLQAPVRVLTGPEEAELTAAGVFSGIHRPDGLAGDFGGGSLELVDVRREGPGDSVTLPLGGLRLSDLAGRSMKRAEKIASDVMDKIPLLDAGQDRDFYAIGGTFRALARLHMAQTGYPLHVMHGYEIDADEALEFCRLVKRVRPNSLDSIDAVAEARRDLLPYGAIVLEGLLLRARPRRLVVSALGVREGLLHSLLPAEERAADPLLAACAELSYLRSRSPGHARELCVWTDAFMASSGFEETADERRLRHAACLLADIGWRIHPDYRGEQSLNLISHASLYGIDHPGRACLALAVYYRHLGLVDDHLSPRLRELVSARMLDRARILGGVLRVAHLVSAAMPGVINKAELVVDEGTLVLRLPGELARLSGSRVASRLRQLARLIGRKARIDTPS